MTAKFNRSMEEWYISIGTDTRDRGYGVMNIIITPETIEEYKDIYNELCVHAEFIMSKLIVEFDDKARKILELTYGRDSLSSNNEYHVVDMINMFIPDYDDIESASVPYIMLFITANIPNIKIFGHSLPVKEVKVQKYFLDFEYNQGTCEIYQLPKQFDETIEDIEFKFRNYCSENKACESLDNLPVAELTFCNSKKPKQVRVSNIELVVYPKNKRTFIDFLGDCR